MSGADQDLTKLCIEASQIIGNNFSRVVVVSSRFAEETWMAPFTMQLKLTLRC